MICEAKHPYDLTDQISALLGALDAVLPYAKQGGIETIYRDAYDEWENIVETLFDSFLIAPLNNTNHTLGASDFAKLGFHYQDDAERARFSLTVSGRHYLLYDIGLAANGHFKLLVFSSESTGIRTLAIGANELPDTESIQIVFSKVEVPNFPMKF